MDNSSLQQVKLNTASTAEIAGRANFDGIRYAQLWEDADVLLLGLDSKPGATLVSICSAGDAAIFDVSCAATVCAPRSVAATSAI